VNSGVAPTAKGVSDGGGPEPGQKQLIEVEQFSRYLWAAQAARARAVLDAGCGTGYGCRLLAEGGAREVLGVDLARAVLEMAAPEMPDSVRLQSGDLHHLELEDNRFELVVCFEVIEYVDDPLTVLAELVRVLAPGGLLLVSAPNPDAHQPGNPFLLHEFARSELESALAARLSHVDLLQQHDYIVSTVAAASGNADREGGGRDLVLEKLPGDSSAHEIYTIAMASDAELPAMHDLAALGGSGALSWWLAALDTQAAQIAHKDDQIAELDARLEERGRLVELLAEAEARSAEVPELKLRISNLEVELEDALRAGAAARQEADQLDRMLMYGRRMLWFVGPLIEPLRRLRRKLRG